MIPAPNHFGLRTIPVRFLLVLVLFLTGFGCASTGPTLSPEGVKTREILGILQAMEAAVEARDAEGLAEHFAWEDLGKRNEFQSRIAGEFSRTTAIDLRMTVDRVVFDPGKITVALFWDGSWMLKDNPAPMPRNGNAVLTFSDSAPPRVLQAAGDLPWAPFPSP